MKSQMFVIYDSKANAYMLPWFLTTNAMAVRAFADCIADPKHNFGAHPEDYTLFHTGDYDNATGIVNSQKALTLGNGLEFKNKLDNELDQLTRGQYPEPKEITEIIKKAKS